jgi:hypothetical protein
MLFLEHLQAGCYALANSDDAKVMILTLLILAVQ